MVCLWSSEGNLMENSFVFLLYGTQGLNLGCQSVTLPAVPSPHPRYCPYMSSSGYVWVTGGENKHRIKETKWHDFCKTPWEKAALSRCWEGVSVRMNLLIECDGEREESRMISKLWVWSTCWIVLLFTNKGRHWGGIKGIYFGLLRQDEGFVCKHTVWPGKKIEPYFRRNLSEIQDGELIRCPRSLQ